MTRLLHSPIGLLVRRIALVYTVLMLCRLIFWLYNARLLDLAWPEAAQLLRGALLFDTASVVYANGAFRPALAPAPCPRTSALAGGGARCSTATT